ncbi:MAG: putative metal-binding motif-containing protein [Myxococcales bacterium]|nr:MAG: putative metal-binding motif-containing protein [Myxococcales bacterium]
MKKYLLLALLPCLSACSLMGLSNGLDPQGCLDKSPDFCDDLNTLQPTGDDCSAWACDPNAGVCAILPLDADKDGAPAAECAPEGVEGDCDDTNPNNAPGLAESCDAADNDCDELIDEGAYALPDPVMLAALAGDEEAEDARYATGDETDPVGIVYTSNKKDMNGGIISRLGFAFSAHLDETTSRFGQVIEGNTTTNNSIIRTPTAITRMGSDSFMALSVFSTIGNYSYGLVPGVLLDNDTSLSYYPGYLGFSGTNVPLPPVSQPAASAVGGDVLVMYQNRAPDPQNDSCQSTNEASLITGLAERQQPNSTYIYARQDSSTQIYVGNGTTDRLSPPAILAFTNSNPSTWIVAYAGYNEIRELGIYIYRVVKTFDSATNNIPVIKAYGPLYKEGTTDGGRLGDVGLAWGEAGDGERQLGLTFRSGCGAQAQSYLRLLSATGGSAALELSPQALVAAPTPSNQVEQIHPSAVWRTADASEWLMIWEEERSFVKAARISKAGELIDSEAYTVLGDDASGTSGLIQEGSFVKSTADGFALVSYIEGDSNKAFWAQSLVCDPGAAK